MRNDCEPLCAGEQSAGGSVLRLTQPIVNSSVQRPGRITPYTLRNSSVGAENDWTP